ncbi:piggyBac transposable element-derived protein 4-like, partial [Cephus cinctus]|uniref:PiggyBac transposable element-derived protein 4-like n=1 Tax=Cephus cinctus TaxID=211228 RepID=A0AAJ7BPS0_CEPCN
MEVMGVRIGPEARHYADRANNRRVDRAEQEATEVSKEHRTAVRNARILHNDAYEDQEGVVYEAGMDIETDSESWTDDEMQVCDNESDSGSDIIIPKKRLRAISESNDDELTEDCTEHASVDEFLDLDTRYSNEKYSFTEVPGPQHPPDSEAKPIEYFSIFFSISLISTMVTETNRYAHQFLSTSKTLKRLSREKKWKPVTILEMKAFIAVLLEMGITRRPTMMCYWNRGSRQIPWFGRMFPRDRFLLIIKFFHLVDNTTLAPPGHPDYDPCGKFNFLVDYANKIFHEKYTPHQQLSIDESL